MAGLSYPFDDGPGSTITEDQWSYLMRDAVGTGVHEFGTTFGGPTAPGPNGSQLRVFSLAEPGIIRVNPGRASINGFHYQQSATEIVAVTANSNPTLDRLDILILRLDLDTNEIALQTRLGVPSGSPSQPALQANELLLASYLVRASSNTVLDSDVNDRRTFVGRRIEVTNQANVGKQGDVQYSPALEKWFGVKSGGSKTSFTTFDDFNAHTSATDPHPQYLTEAEGFTTTTNGTLTSDPLMTVIAGYHKSLNLPGGFKIVNLYYHATFNGATQSSAFTIVTLNEPALRPNFSFRFVCHQWLFANSTDDIPLIVTINPSGSVRTGAETWLMGGAKVLINCTYFVGPGV